MPSFKSRPDFLQRRIDFQLARQNAKRTHPQPCACPYCIAQDRVEAIIRKRVEAEARANGPAPF